jgi:antirestriction protein ArdC
VDANGQILRIPSVDAAFLHIMDCCGLLEVLREDNRAIVRAASQASKAADWLLAFLPDTGDGAEGSEPGAAAIDRRAA